MDSDINDFLNYLLYSIKHSFVHSTVAQGYSLYAIGDSLEDYDFLLTTNYSYTDTFDVWIEYNIYFNKTPTIKLILPLNTPIKDDFAVAVLNIFKKCSNKVIAQEKLAKKSRFWRSIITDENTPQL